MVSLWPKPAGFPLPDINARLRAAARSPDTGDDLRNTEFVVVIYYTVENNQAYIFYFIKTVSDTCNLLPSKFPLRTNCISHFMLARKAPMLPKGQTRSSSLSPIECWMLKPAPLWSVGTLRPSCSDIWSRVSVSGFVLPASIENELHPIALSLVIWTHHKSDSSTFSFLRLLFRPERKTNINNREDKVQDPNSAPLSLWGDSADHWASAIFTSQHSDQNLAAPSANCQLIPSKPPQPTLWTPRLQAGHRSLPELNILSVSRYMNHSKVVNMS